MSPLESNMSFLRDIYPEVFNLINKAHDSKGLYESSVTRNGEPNLQIFVEGKTFYLHSNYNAKEESRKWIQSVRDKILHSKQILITGIGLGTYLEELLLTTNAKDIFIYEPSVDILKELLKKKDIIPLLSDQRIRLLAVGDDQLVQHQIGDFISQYISGSFAMISPPIYEKLFPEVLNKFELNTRDMLINQRANFQTLTKNQTEWLSNILCNLPHVVANSNVKVLMNVWRDKHVKAIIVGSGPSLKKDIHYLTKLKDKCLIIAAGSSIQALEYHGVYPHFVVTMDGTLSNYDVFKNIDVSQVPLVFCSQTHYAIVDDYRSELFSLSFGKDTITNQLLDPEDSLPSFLTTATVTGTAMQIAAYMGVSEVILMGQDLSYPDDQFYAAGVNHVTEEDKHTSISKANLTVENVDGGENRTSSGMNVLKKSVELITLMLSSQGIRVINTSKKGAVIEGTEWVSMDILAPTLIDSPSREFDISIYKSIKKDEDIIRNLSKVNERLNEVLGQIVKMEIKIKKLNDWISKLERGLTNRNMKTINRALLEVNKLWNWITKQDLFKVFYNFSLEHKINVYMRYVPEIVETTETMKKARLIVDHLGILIKQIDAFNPDLIVTIREAMDRIEKYRINE